MAMATRVLISLGDERTARLDALAEQRGESRSALIREAVDKLIHDEGDEKQRIVAALREGFGAWRHRTDIGDAAEWQRRNSAATTRPWDDAYEEIRAEYPDLFDAEDDRQRAIYLDMIAGRHPVPREPGRS